MAISGRTRICGIIGNPIEHSLSPKMHNAAFLHLGLNFVYVPFRVNSIKSLKPAMDGIRSLGIRGLNVTMPYKSAVVDFLDQVDPATDVNVINTIANENGKLTGYNTDGIGALKALKENKIDPNGMKILLIGAGDAAKAIAFHLVPDADELVISNRSREKGRNLANDLEKGYEKKIKYIPLVKTNLKDTIKNSDIIINATSVGMHPNSNQSLIESDWLDSPLCVMDIVYSPIETKLVRNAKSIGIKTVDGLQMLIFQGASAFEIWTNRPAPVKAMQEAILNEISMKDDRN